MVIATSTLEAFLGTTFDLGISTMLYALGVIWPYLVTVAVLFLFWKIGRSFFRG